MQHFYTVLHHNLQAIYLLSIAITINKCSLKHYYYVTITTIYRIVHLTTYTINMQNMDVNASSEDDYHSGYSSSSQQDEQQEQQCQQQQQYAISKYDQEYNKIISYISRNYRLLCIPKYTVYCSKSIPNHVYYINNIDILYKILNNKHQHKTAIDIIGIENNRTQYNDVNIIYKTEYSNELLHYYVSNVNDNNNTTTLTAGYIFETKYQTTDITNQINHQTMYDDIIQRNYPNITIPFDTVVYIQHRYCYFIDLRNIIYKDKTQFKHILDNYDINKKVKRITISDDYDEYITQHAENKVHNANTNNYSSNSKEENTQNQYSNINIRSDRSATNLKYSNGSHYSQQGICNNQYNNTHNYTQPFSNNASSSMSINNTLFNNYDTTAIDLDIDDNDP